jgi:hypothetical protein
MTAGDCLLITTPAVDFDQFLAAGHQMTGRSLSSAADANRRPISDAEKFLSCLSILNGDAGVGLSPRLLSHVSFSMLVWGAERDLLDVFQLCGMPFVVTDTVARGIQASVMTGTLTQWRDAIASGLRPAVEPSVRHFFGQMLVRFEQSGLSAVWQDFTKKTAPIGFYLEDKR